MWGFATFLQNKEMKNNLVCFISFLIISLTATAQQETLIEIPENLRTTQISTDTYLSLPSGVYVVPNNSNLRYIPVTLSYSPAQEGLVWKAAPLESIDCTTRKPISPSIWDHCNSHTSTTETTPLCQTLDQLLNVVCPQ